MRFSHPSLWLVLSLLTLPASGQRAAEPWDVPPFSLAPTELLRVVPDPARTRDGVAVAWVDVEVRFDAEGRSSTRQHLVYRILSREGVAVWGSVEAGWAPWYQDEPEIRARVITPDGLEHPLDPATLSESPVAAGSPELFGDLRRRRAPLPALGLGAVVEIETVIDDREPFFDAGVAGQRPLAAQVPVASYRLTLDYPEQLPLRHAVRLAPGVATESSTGAGRVRLSFVRREVPAREPVETGLPPSVPRSPRVAYATGTSWQTVARRYAALVDEQIAGAELDALRRSVPPRLGETQSERLLRLLARVRHEVRYTGLELGRASLVPVRPAETLKRKYGDCKDQAALLVALLRAEGISAHVALLTAGSDEDAEPELPGLGTFDHAIVHVGGGEGVWIDPSHPFSRPGELPVAAQGRLALIADGSSTELVRTPEAPASANTSSELREVFVADYGQGRVRLRAELRGTLEHAMRENMAWLDLAERREHYLGHLREALLAGELGSVVEDADPGLERPVTLAIEIPKAGRVLTDLDNAVVVLVPSELLLDLPAELVAEKTPPRQGDYLLRRPYVAEHRYRIVPPAGFVLRDLPADETRELGPARLERELWREGGEVHVRFRFSTGERRMSAEQFEAFRRGVRALVESGAVRFHFEHPAAAPLAAQKPREAVFELRRLIAEQPDNALHRVRLARLLLGWGLGEEAARQAQLALEKGEQLAIVHWMLGRVHQHDAIGRRFAPGWDLAAARAALERARELDPGDTMIRAELISLLERGATGHRFAPDADLDAAIAERRAWREDFEPADELALLDLLFHDRRWQEVVDESAEMAPEAKRNGLRLAALALTRGVSAAVSESERLETQRERRAAALALAAQSLAFKGELELAGQLAAHVDPGAAKTPGLARFAERLRRARSLARLELPADDPSTPFKRLLLLLTQPKIELADLAEIAWPEPTAADLEAIAGWVELGAALAAAYEGASLESVLGLYLAMLDVESEGDDERGYRLRLSSSLSVRSQQDVYVVKTAAGFRMLLREMPRGPAEEALRRLESGDLAGARLWLDWMREGRSTAFLADPWAGDAFAHLWRAGEPADLETTSGAVAALLALAGSPELAVPRLRAALARAEGERRRWLEIALGHALLASGDTAAAAELAEGWLAASPDSAAAAGLLFAALRDGAHDERAARFARERLERRSDDPTAWLVLAELAMERGDASEGLQRYARVSELQPDDPGPWNNRAWMLVFAVPVPPQALEMAQRAVELSEYRNPSTLHTLASVLAELGRPTEAYPALVQSLALERDKKPGSEDWYVLGRIAEELGLAATARELYERVEKPENVDGFSAWKLARRRLTELGVGEFGLGDGGVRVFCSLQAYRVSLANGKAEQAAK